jgi:hypothetical protein
MRRLIIPSAGITAAVVRQPYDFSKIFAQFTG